MPRTLLLTLALFGFILLWVGAYLTRHIAIEDDLTERVRQVLAADGAGRVRVGFDGRDGILFGTVADETTRANLAARAQAVWGVRTIENDLTLDPALVGTPAGSSDTSHEPALEIALQDQGIVLRGAVPSTYDRLKLLQTAEDYFEPDKVADMLEVAPGKPLPATLAEVVRLLLQQDNLQNASLSLTDSGLQLQGDVADREEQYRIVTEVRQAAGELPLQDLLRVTWFTSSDPQLQQALTDFLDRHTIEFEYGSAQVTVPTLPTLRELAQRLQAAPQAQVEIQGHTDSSGSEAANLRVSTSRAKSVRSYLISQGVSAARLTAVGYGESRPLTDNDSEEGRQRNRRVSLRVQ